MSETTHFFEIFYLKLTGVVTGGAGLLLPLLDP